jgi:hypothetical protein
VFAGFFIPYTPKPESGETTKPLKPIKSSKTINIPNNPLPKVEKKNAILGGGDIAFPLLFTGAVMESLMVKGLTQAAALTQSLIITATTTIAVALLFIFAKKDKFYPAMPIISAGCFIGYGILMMIV